MRGSVKSDRQMGHSIRLSTVLSLLAMLDTESWGQVLCPV